MRSTTFALTACLALAAVLAGCANNPGESADDTDQVSGNITVTCPEDNTTMDSNMSTNETDCPDDTDNSTTSTNTTGSG